MSAPRRKSYRVRFQAITCYALDVAAPSPSAAIAAATERFYRLSVAKRADAAISDSELDYFEAEEGGAQ